MRLTQRWAELFKNLPAEGKKYGVDFSQEEDELICHGYIRPRTIFILWPTK